MANLQELLFRGESDALDFKRDQYPFVDCPDAVKAELLKDILAMANSWRSETAYILIGVDEPPPFPARVVGVKTHIDDASLQQFVTGKTQRPLTFLYRQAELHGHQIGVIEVPVQQRPFHLVKDFYGLKAGVVYLRRGSATAIASPDEIAKMGAADAGVGKCDLEVQFAANEKRELLGTNLTLECADWHVAEEPDLPDFDGDVLPGPFIPGLRKPNPEFYRELVALAKDAALLRPAALTVRNNGQVAAHEIRVEFTVADQSRIWEFKHPSQVRQAWPERHYDYLSASPLLSTAPFISSVAQFNADYLVGTWHLVYKCGHLQPGCTLWPAIEFHLGARRSGSLALSGRVLADGLPTPAPFELHVSADVLKRRVTLSELESFYKEGTKGADKD